MSFKWTIGAVIAVVAGMFMLPGIASADHEVVITANTDCDGTFVIDADYHASTILDFQTNVVILVNGEDWDDEFGDAVNDNPGDTDVPGPFGTTVDHDSDAYQTAGGPDSYQFDNVDDNEDFFVMNGTYNNVAVDAPGSIIVASSSDAINDSATVTDGLDGSWSECVTDFCVAGDSDGGTDLSFLATPTGDCNAVSLCVNNVNVIVSEFTADEQGLVDDADGCVPGDAAPPPPPVVEEEAPPVEETATESEVAGAVEEVVALPSTGSGTSSGGMAWAAVAALAMIGIGGSVAVAARRNS